MTVLAADIYAEVALMCSSGTLYDTPLPDFAIVQWPKYSEASRA